MLTSFDDSTVKQFLKEIHERRRVSKQAPHFLIGSLLSMTTPIVLYLLDEYFHWVCHHCTSISEEPWTVLFNVALNSLRSSVVTRNLADFYFKKAMHSFQSFSAVCTSMLSSEVFCVINAVFDRIFLVGFYTHCTVFSKDVQVSISNPALRCRYQFHIFQDILWCLVCNFGGYFLRDCLTMFWKYLRIKTFW